MGVVTFQEGDLYGYLVLSIIPDGVPELDEVYTVTLTGATGGAVLDSEAVTSTFKIL